MIEKRVHRHSEDSCFISAPPPETQRKIFSTKMTQMLGLGLIRAMKEPRKIISHRKRAARHCNQFAYAAFPGLFVRGERPQSNGGLTRWWEGNIQRAAWGSRKTEDMTEAKEKNKRGRVFHLWLCSLILSYFQWKNYICCIKKASSLLQSVTDTLPHHKEYIYALKIKAWKTHPFITSDLFLNIFFYPFSLFSLTLRVQISLKQQEGAGSL